MSTVNIYLATTHPKQQSELEARYLRQLPDSEQQRYKTLHPKRQLEWLHARALLHTALTEHYGFGAGLQHLQRHDKGGLYFPDKNLSISISHTHNIVGVALINQSVEIGLDLEIMRARKIIDHADKVFSPTETASLADQAPEQRLRAFYHLWTLKEACIKACRQTVWRDMSTLVFDNYQTGRFTSPNSTFHGQWSVAYGTPLHDLQLTLAIRKSSITTLQLWQADDSLRKLTAISHNLRTDQLTCTFP